MSLISRLRDADGPSRELDAEIAQEIGWLRVGRRQNYTNVVGTPPGRDGNLGNGIRTIPHFTSSLDAAMTLVPEGWFCTLDISPPGTTCEARLDANNGSFLGSASTETDGAAITAPLALCIAALLARGIEP